MITIYDPTFIGSNAFKTPNTSWSLKAINSNYPILEFLLSGMILKSFLQMLIVVGIYYIYRQLALKSMLRKILVMFFIALPFVLPLRPGIIYFFTNVLWISSLFFLIRYFWKENPWSYILGIIGFFTLPDIIIYFNTIQDPSFRVQGFAAIIFIIIPLLYFAREAFLVRVDSSG